MMLYVGAHYSVASLLATVLGVVWNFHTTGGLVFDSIDRRKAFRFVGVYVFLYFEGLAVLRVGELMGYTPYVVGAVMLLPNAVLGYWLNKHLVFMPRS